MLKTLTIEQYCDSLASANPTPGGGSALANIAVNAIALLQMAVNVTKTKFDKLEKAYDHSVTDTLATLNEAHENCLAMIDGDAELFSNILAESKKAKLTNDYTALQQTYIDSANSCLQLTKICVACYKLTDGIIAFADKYVVSDAYIGKAMIAQVAKCSTLNVNVNTKYITDKSVANLIEEMQQKLTAELI